MKKVKKILVIIVTILTIFCIAQPVTHAVYYDKDGVHSTYESESKFEGYSDPIGPTRPDTTYGIDANFYNPNKADDPNIDTDIIKKYVVPIYNILQYALIIAAVISLMIIGSKLILGSTSEKAEYKQHLIPIVVGIWLAAFLFTIIKILLKFAGIF